MVKSMNYRVRQTWMQIPALPFMALRSAIVPASSSKNGDNCSSKSITLLQEQNETMLTKCLSQRLAQIKSPETHLHRFPGHVGNLQGLPLVVRVTGGSTEASVLSKCQ